VPGTAPKELPHEGRGNYPKNYFAPPKKKKFYLRVTSEIYYTVVGIEATIYLIVFLRSKKTSVG